MRKAPSENAISAVFDGGDDQCSRVLSVLVDARAEDGVDTLSESVAKCVEMRMCLHIIEGHLSSFIVQKDAQLLRQCGEMERNSVSSEGFHFSTFQPQTPEATLWTETDLSFASCRPPGHSYGPGCLMSYVHLPVVSSRGNTLARQDKQRWAKAPRSVGMRGAFALLFIVYLPAVLGNTKITLSCGRIQDNLTYDENQNHVEHQK